MPRGGAGRGQGRKKGSRTRRVREIAEKVAASGLTPLEVMDKAMKAHMAAAQADPLSIDKDELDKAASIAKDMAPYIHPRLAAVQHFGNIIPDSVADVTGTLMFARKIAYLLAMASMASGGQGFIEREEVLDERT